MPLEPGSWHRRVCASHKITYYALFSELISNLPTSVLSPVAGNNCCRTGNHPDNSPQLSGWWSFWQHGTGAHVNGNSGHRKSNDYRAWDIHFGDGDDTKDDPATPPPGSPKDVATRAGTPYTPGELIDLNLPVFPVEDGYVEKLHAESSNASVTTTNSSNALLIYHPSKGYWSAYLHMNMVNVKLGDPVYKDRTLLGLIGTKCNSCEGGTTSPHLHLALYRGANTSNNVTGFSELISFDLPDGFVARPNPPSPSQTDFRIDPLSPVTAGGTVSSTLTAVLLSGTAGTTPMAILNCPNTISCSFNPPSVIPTPSGTQSTLSITTINNTQSNVYGLTIRAGIDLITIPLRVTAPRQLVISSSTSLPDGKVGIGYSTTLTATGGTAPYTWQILRGALPPGLSLSSGGLISGMPTSSGSFSFRAQVLDGNFQQDQTTLTITVEGIPPTVPTLTTLSECREGTTPQIRLMWTASSGVDYYQVFRNGFAFSGVSDSSTTNSTTFLDTQVTIGTSYTYSIVAINSGGKARSNEVTETARCDVAPGAFTLEVITLCRENAPVNLVSWTGSSGRTQPYEIYRNSSLLGTGDMSRYDDTAVSGGSIYTYLMRARNSVGQRDSNAVTILTKSDCAAPVAPVITSITPQSVTIGTGDFTLTVNGQNFDGRTRLLYSQAGSTPASPVFPTSVTSTMLTFRILQTSSGFFTAFPAPGAYDIQVFKPVSNFYDGRRSGTSTFTVFNPAPSGNLGSGMTIDLLWPKAGVTRGSVPATLIRSSFPTPSDGESPSWNAAAWDYTCATGSIQSSGFEVPKTSNPRGPSRYA